MFQCPSDIQAALILQLADLISIQYKQKLVYLKDIWSRVFFRVVENSGECLNCGSVNRSLKFAGQTALTLRTNID